MLLVYDYDSPPMKTPPLAGFFFGYDVVLVSTFPNEGMSY
jgi:hypothetical protein